MDKITAVKRADSSFLGWAFYCPGCECDHIAYTEESWNGQDRTGGVWNWNGDRETPTFTPSLKITYPLEGGKSLKICHFFVEAGQIRYLSDCTHGLKGKTVQMEDYK